MKTPTGVYLVLLLLGFMSAVSLLAISTDPAALRLVLHDPLTLVLVGVAAFRGGRAIAYNFIFSWLRAPFTVVVDDSSGAGKSVEASGRGLRRVIGELLCCPTCAGTWVAVTLVGLLVRAYPLGLTLAFVLAASGIGEMLHWRAERDEWQGRAAREEAGTAWLWKNADHNRPAGATQPTGEPRSAPLARMEPYIMEACYEEKKDSLV